MATANSIIDALGGTSAVAGELNLTPSVVHGWRRSNFIPLWRQPSVLAVAVKKGVALSTVDFPSVAERVRKAAA